MNSKLISIIVPIYNAEKYIKRCIESILNQTYTNLEIILVNDGSQDKSLEICNSFAIKDTRIKVIDKKNEGVSKARNEGIDVASGEYIIFVDGSFSEADKFASCAVLIFNNNNLVDDNDKEQQDANIDNNKDNVQEENNDSSNVEESVLSNDTKMKINEELRNLSYEFAVVLISNGVHDVNDIKNIDNIFEDELAKFTFVKLLMNKYKLVNYDDSGIYEKCALGTGSISIKEESFSSYYKKLFGEDFDKSKLENIMFVDGYICTAIGGIAGTQAPLLKVISRNYDANKALYEMNIVVLGNVVDSASYASPEILTWPKEKETAMLNLKYKINDDNSYQIISFIAHGVE